MGTNNSTNAARLDRTLLFERAASPQDTGAGSLRLQTDGMRAIMLDGCGGREVAPATAAAAGTFCMPDSRASTVGPSPLDASAVARAAPVNSPHPACRAIRSETNVIAPSAAVHPITAHEVTTCTLRAMPIFAHTPDAALQVVARASILRYVPRSVQVVRAGVRTDFVYLVVSGSLNVLVGDEDGHDAILSLLGPGELFGEMGVLDDEPCSATVMAVMPSVLVMIGKQDFMRCLTENFDVTQYVTRKLVQRLRMANRTIESLALFDVAGRIARLLLGMAETVNGKQVISGKISKRNIAKMVGATRETVSRILRDLETRGLIALVEGHIELHGDASR